MRLATRESFSGRLELLRNYYRGRPLDSSKDDREPAKNQSSFPSLNPRFKLALALFMALTVGNLPEFSIPGSARLNVFCSEVDGKRMLTVDATHLEREIDRGKISLVYRKNPARGDLTGIFPYDNSSWIEHNLEPPYRLLESTPLEMMIGDRIDIRKGFVKPDDVDKMENVLDGFQVTEECFQRTVE